MLSNGVVETFAHSSVYIVQAYAAVVFCGTTRYDDVTAAYHL